MRDPAQHARLPRSASERGLVLRGRLDGLVDRHHLRRVFGLGRLRSVLFFKANATPPSATTATNDPNPIAVMLFMCPPDDPCPCGSGKKYKRCCIDARA